MSISDNLDMGEMRMDRSGMKKGFIYKPHNNTYPGCPQECVGYYESVRERNRAEDGSDSHISKVRTDTCNSMMLRKREISREVRRYAGIARENIGIPLEQYNPIIYNLSISSRYIITELCSSLA